MAHKYTLTVNGFDLTDMVERDSYSTSLFPVTTPMITTMDGIDHTRLIRHKARVQVTLNPQTAEQTALLTAALMTSPMTVCAKILYSVFSSRLSGVLPIAFIKYLPPSFTRNNAKSP